MRPAALLLSAAPLWALPACGSTVAPAPADATLVDAAPDASTSPDAPAPDVAPDGAPDARAPVTVTWSPCPLHSEGDGPDAECADVAVPLDRARPAGPTIRVRVKRYHPDGGRSLRAAVDTGFGRAWPSIRDSNVSTLITCTILWFFGSAFGASLVQGFALTLALGVLVSLFTAILVTRTLLHLILDNIDFSARHAWFRI